MAGGGGTGPCGRWSSCMGNTGSKCVIWVGDLLTVNLAIIIYTFFAQIAYASTYLCLLFVGIQPHGQEHTEVSSMSTDVVSVQWRPNWPLRMEPFAVITSPSSLTAPAKAYKNVFLFNFSCNQQTCITWMAWASSLLSSSVFIVTNRNTSRFKEAATMAKPNRIKISENITYSGFWLKALSFCNAT